MLKGSSPQVDKEKEKEGSKEQRSELSLALANDRIGSGIRGQDVKSMGKGTRGLVDTRSFALSMGKLEITEMNVQKEPMLHEEVPW